MASAAGIEEPVTLKELSGSRGSRQVIDEIGDIERSTPLYFRGTRLIKFELDQLKSREDDRPLVADLAEMENKILAAQNDPVVAALKRRVNDAIYIEKFDDLQRELSNLKLQKTDL